MASRQLFSRLTSYSSHIFKRNVSLSLARPSAAAAAPSAASAEAPILSPTEADPKIRSIVDQISKLTLLEVAELNTVLKETLKIPDAPVMAFSAGAGAAPAAAAPEEGEEDQSKTVQTAFTLKITKFDDTKKVALIKEIKTVVEGLNLVQAKKFVESVPQVVKSNVSKDEAEKLQKQLEAAGATCQID